VGDLSAAHAVARAPEQSLADLTWIAHGDTVYLVVGVTAEARFEQVGPLLRAVAQSFAPITAAERGRVREARLRVMAPREGETLEALLSRVGSSWGAEEAIVVNALPAGGLAAAGRELKIALPEPYPAVSARP
jgi:predicted Zn-dependent protease